MTGFIGRAGHLLGRLAASFGLGFEGARGLRRFGTAELLDGLTFATGSADTTPQQLNALCGPLALTISQTDTEALLLSRVEPSFRRDRVYN